MQCLHLWKKNPEKKFISLCSKYFFLLNDPQIVTRCVTTELY